MEDQAKHPEPTAPESEDQTIRVDEMQALLDEAREQHLRALAELDNTRKRAQRDIENAHRFALDRFIADLAPVRESLEMGLGAATGVVAEGLAMTLNQLDQALAKHGVAVVDPAGAAFDPALHEAMQVFPTDEVAPDTVVQVLQKGLTLNGRLLRPALVVVARAPDGA
jgi:molecular chaperone GrpE